jgi:threonine dehydratase
MTIALRASPAPLITIDHIRAAAAKIKGKVLRTPTVYSPRLSKLTGAEVYVKYENFQATGAYKERGALNKLLSLSEGERQRGVIAMSAGNHAQALAYHAARLGAPTVIVMPESTPFVKIGATEALGAEVVLAGETVAEACGEALEIAARRSLTFVHPYDDPLVMAGQGTIGLELMEDQPDLDCVIVPIGGGGLISGVGTALKSINPEIEVFGAQAEAYPSMWAALRGETPTCGGQTLAEGIAVKTAGELTLPLVRQLVADIILASEDALEQAICAFVSHQKAVAEGAGAAGLAALLTDPGRFAGRKTGLVLSGGNIDPGTLSSLLVRGLRREDKIISLRVIIPDQAGMLARVASCVGGRGANVLEVSHRRMFLDVPAKRASLDLVIETRGREHARTVIEDLKAAGFPVHKLNGRAETE